MTKSTITRERIEQYANDPRMCNINDEIRELARIALAAMDSEPVAWTDEEELRDVNVAGIGYLFGIDREANKFSDPRRQIMLYRHAQPATASEPLAVTDDELNAALQLHRLKVDGHSQLSDAFRAGFRYARRTTPQPAPVVSADLLHTAASAIEDLLTTKDRTGACVWFDLPFRLRSAANAHSAPVAPDGYVMVPVEPNGDMLAAAQDAYGETDGDIASTLRAAMLAAAPQEVKGE